MISETQSSRWLDRPFLKDTALLALAVLFGLQLLRVLLNGLVFYIRDFLGTGPFVPGGYALVLFLGAFLAVVVVKFLGIRGGVMVAASGLGAARLAEQFVPWPVVDPDSSSVE